VVRPLADLDTGGLTVQAPANANLAPPGHYLLFIVDGVPSVAKIVRIP
jgi:galactose oxidase